MVERTWPTRSFVFGDATDHGGKAISGSPVHTVDGPPIARLGDEVDCPQHYPSGKRHGVNNIITAHPTVKVGDVPIAVQDCVTECGCTFIGNKKMRAE